MLYLMAICAGACITHTLVPPTPGPLFIAAAFKIDLGLMILMGFVVALPTAIVTLLVCRAINRLVDTPMRAYSGAPDPEPLTDAQLPPLWLSLLPVVLPVLLISTNTVAQVVARADSVNLLTQRLVSAGILADTNDARSLASGLVNANVPGDMNETAPLADLLATERLIAPEQVQAMAQKLLTGKILSSAESTPRPAQRAANVTAILGSPNLALLVSAVVAMALLVWKRKVPLKRLTESVDNALMSGGVIILITAGGGAFGAMLRAAGIQTAIESLFGSGTQHVGIMIFLAAFAVTAMLKFAQGSSTVAMITTSSMFAAMGITTDMLGCHHVYLALAIGGGSLVGSWMNDSGFWIVARMGAITEAEALKSWSILSASLGAISFGFTLLLSRLVPLV
jgi:H+/gluconate symporter-like permease